MCLLTRAPLYHKEGTLEMCAVFPLIRHALLQNYYLRFLSNAMFYKSLSGNTNILLMLEFASQYNTSK